VKNEFAVQQATELLEGLSKEMGEAAKHPDPDAIHDVRVAIRRLRQCLDVFSSVFPARAAEKIDKRLAKILDAAGELRNLDIAIELLKSSAAGPRIGSQDSDGSRESGEGVHAHAREAGRRRCRE
jgi:CHAD domain-containing protein